MNELYVGQFVMDKITKHILRITKIGSNYIELYDEKIKNLERFTNEWFNDLFLIC